MHKIALILFITLFSSDLFASWSFTTGVGQTFRVDYEKVKKEFSITSDDVTVRLDFCEPEHYLVCFMSNYLDLAIPINPPAIGDNWAVLGSHFELFYIVPSMDLFGKTYKDVLVINVERNQQFYYQGEPEIKHSQLLYSYDEGLLMFYRVNESGFFTPLVASNIPSLGARPVGN